MNTITFPLLNLNMKIDPVAFEIFGLEIHWYAIFIVSAMILALIIFKIRDDLYNIKFEDILDLAVFVIPIAIISARIYYIIFNLEYYIKSPEQILNLRTGGLAIYGGIIGGLITCIIFCRKRKIKILDLLDFIAPALALRTSNRKMGKLCKYRSLWGRNKCAVENGNIWIWKVYRSTPNIFIWINSYIDFVYYTYEYKE